MWTDDRKRRLEPEVNQMTKQICAAAGVAIVAIAASAFQKPAPADQPVEARIRALSKNRNRYAERTKRDAQIHSASAMEEIETLYQIGHMHDGQTAKQDVEKAIKSHNLLIAKYPGTNRAGCALLDMADFIEGPGTEEYLKRAIAEYSDSYFGNGVSVGAYGRYKLAWRYRRQHRDQEAAVLFDEIRSQYHDAVAPDGKPLASLLP
jgi:hypothetical protein